MDEIVKITEKKLTRVASQMAQNPPEKPKLSFMDRVASFIDKNPFISKTIAAVVAGVAGAFTAGAGALAVGAGFAGLEYVVEKMAEKRVDEIEAQEARFEFETQLKEQVDALLQANKAQDLEKVALVREKIDKLMENVQEKAEKSEDKGEIARLDGYLEVLKLTQDLAAHDMASSEFNEKKDAKKGVNTQQNNGNPVETPACVKKIIDEHDNGNHAEKETHRLQNDEEGASLA